MILEQQIQELITRHEVGHKSEIGKSKVSKPQNPPFAFPDSIKFEKSTALPLHSEDMNLIKDKSGPIICMGYAGPTPYGETSTSIWIVSHDTPTRVHPAEKYVHQRYRKI